MLRTRLYVNVQGGVDDCFEQGDPETLLTFHNESMRNIATKEEGVSATDPLDGTYRIAWSFILVLHLLRE